MKLAAVHGFGNVSKGLDVVGAGPLDSTLEKLKAAEKEKQDVTHISMTDWGDICYATYGGDMVGWDLLWGYCYSGDCLGIYTIICDNGFERRPYRDTCVDTACWQCNIQ